MRLTLAVVLAATLALPAVALAQNYNPYGVSPTASPSMPIMPAIPPVSSTAPMAPAMPAMPTQNFEQYPSFIQSTAMNQDGSSTVTRCAYTDNGSGFASDASYLESTTMNQANGYYLRYQRANTFFIVTVPAPNMPGRFFLEILTPQGNVEAKSCAVSITNDTIQNCSAAPLFMQANQIIAQDQSAVSQCTNIFGTMQSQMRHGIYNTLKTEILKNSLQQKVNILAGP